jgi:putative sigma-54 modulation protein
MSYKAAKGKATRKAEQKAKTATRRARQEQTVVTVTFRHVEPTDAIRLYAERKLAHVSRLVKRPCEAHVILTVDKYRQHGEVTVKSGSLSVTAEEETKDLYSVIDLLADKVSRQLKKTNGKRIARHTRALSTGEVASAAEEF